MAKKNKVKLGRQLSDEVQGRGCKTCGRWQIFAKAIYQESGELCDADTCPNLNDAHSSTIFYAESDALNEKSDD